MCQPYLQRYLFALLLLTSCLFANCHTNATEQEPKKVQLPQKPVKRAVPKPYVWQPPVYDTSKQYIYITFDDGPQPGTMACLQVCLQQKVKASFFMVARHQQLKSDGKQIVQAIKKQHPNMLLCNHSYSHAYGKYRYFYKHPYMALSDFLVAQKQLGIPYKIIRLPGNSAWVRKDTLRATKLVRPICSLLDSTGYNVIGWDAEWRFSHTSANPIETPQVLADQIERFFTQNKTHLPKHLVLLTHDRMFRLPNYTDSLTKLITILKSNPKNVFETVDNYPRLKMP